MRLCLASVLWVATCFVLPARAEHADIDLRVMRVGPDKNSTGEEAQAFADRDPPPGGLRERPLFKAQAGEPLALQFILTNTYPHGEKKHVTVHYFIVREQKPRQKTLPDLTTGVVTQGRFTLNFKPKCRVGARAVFTIKESGTYLLRVQTENTDSDHEHFAAIDIQVE